MLHSRSIYLVSNNVYIKMLTLFRLGEGEGGGKLKATTYARLIIIFKHFATTYLMTSIPGKRAIQKSIMLMLVYKA